MDEEAEIKRLLRAVRAQIDALPAAERLSALLKLIAVMLEYLSREQVLSLRAEVVAAYGDADLGEALDLLDGHLALRELKDE